MKILTAIAVALAFIVLVLLWRNDSLASRADAAETQITTLTNALESRKKTQALLSDLDTQHTQELANAQKANAQLRADIAAGKRRLSIALRKPDVRTATGAASVDDAQARADVDPAAGERIFAVGNDGDDAIRQLSALQDWVRTACLKPPME